MRTNLNDIEGIESLFLLASMFSSQLPHKDIPVSIIMHYSSIILIEIHCSLLLLEISGMRALQINSQ